MRKPEIIWIMHTSPNPPAFCFLTRVFCRNLFLSLHFPLLQFLMRSFMMSCFPLSFLVALPSLQPFHSLPPILHTSFPSLLFFLSPSALLCVSSLLVLRFRFHRSCKNLSWSALKLKHVRIISSTAVHSTGALLLSHLIRRAFKITVFKRISEDSFGPFKHSLVFSHSDNTGW